MTPRSNVLRDSAPTSHLPRFRSPANSPSAAPLATPNIPACIRRSPPESAAPAHLVFQNYSGPEVSNPIQLHPALRNSALSLPALWPLRPIPVRPDEQQLPGGFSPVVVRAPTPQRLAGSRSQNLARSPGDNGVRVLPIVPRILLGSTSDTTLSRLINLGLSCCDWRAARIQPVKLTVPADGHPRSEGRWTGPPPSDTTYCCASW